MNRTNIMVDIETLGKNADSPIIQIAAASFDITTGKIIDTFDECCDIACYSKDVKINGDTLKWWLKTDADLLNQLLNKSNRDPDDMIFDFLKWIDKQGDFHNRYLWGNGILFDNNMIKTHMEEIGLEYPIFYRNDRDMRTIVDLAAMKLGLESATEFGRLHSDKSVRAHDAMNDVKTQVHIMHEAYKVIMGIDKTKTSTEHTGYKEKSYDLPFNVLRGRKSKQNYEEKGI